MPEKPAVSRDRRPDEDFLKKTKKLIEKRWEEARKLVDQKRSDWDELRDMYHNEMRSRQHDWESNLIIPKPYYIVQTITPQIMQAVFGHPDFLTCKSPRLNTGDAVRLSQWFAWFLLRKMQIYPRLLELFTESPIIGTSFLKLYMKNGVPAADFARADEVYVDPRTRRPGEIDASQFVFHRFKRDWSQIEQATVTRMVEEEVQVPVFDQETGEVMETQTVTIPTLKEEPLYFGLDELWKKYVLSKDTQDARSEDHEVDVQVDLPTLELVEMWGEIETTFGSIQVDGDSPGRYTPGQYQEYVVTCVLKGEKIEEVIRCEPSGWKYLDELENREIYVKPFVSSIYSSVPGQFHGMSAIEPVQSLIEEMKEHHDLFMDNHKRSVMTILSVLERSGLTERDLPFSPYAHWVVRSHDDVQPVQFPEINMQAFNMIHALIDREIDRTAGSSPQMQGNPVTKRQTAQEVSSLMIEASRRFTTFIQMADHLTLRPLARKTAIMMLAMPQLQQGQPFMMPDEEVVIDPASLVGGVEYNWAATGIEPEHSKYQKQELFPKLLRELAGVSQASGGKYILNMEEVVGQMADLYNFYDMENWVYERRPEVPVDVLMMAAGDDPRMKQMVQQLVQQAQTIMEVEEEMQKKKGRPSKSGGVGPK